MNNDGKVSIYLSVWPIRWAVPQGGSLYWNAGMINGQYLADIIISFAVIDPADGFSLFIPELRKGGFPNLWDETAALKKKFPHMKVNISVGGAFAEGFSDMAHDPAKRAGFAASVAEWLEKHDLDGVDVDWEYPVGPPSGQSIKSRPEDKENYISLLREAREALDALGAKTGKQYTLSTAVPAGGWFTTAVDVKAASEIAELKLMCYDYYGSWCRTTGHLANLYQNPQDPAEGGGWSTDQCIEAYLKAGVRPEKMQLGLPFYGRAFRGVAPGPNGDGLFQPYAAPGFPDKRPVTWPLIQELLKEGSGYTRYWDETAQAPYLYNGDVWISYTDPQQIQLLADYGAEKNLGGFFSWEYTSDINGDLLKVLAENA